jgi:hypothetical protein
VLITLLALEAVRCAGFQAVRLFPDDFPLKHTKSSLKTRIKRFFIEATSQTERVNLMGGIPDTAGKPRHIARKGRLLNGRCSQIGIQRHTLRIGSKPHQVLEPFDSPRNPTTKAIKPPISRPVTLAVPDKGSPPPNGAIAVKIIKSKPPSKTAKDLALFINVPCLEKLQISSQLFTP